MNSRWSQPRWSSKKTVIVVQPAQPEVIYVPSYSPTVVYGPPPIYYPYPPIYYPPYPPGGAFVAFSVGVAWGAAVWGGSCCGCAWGHNDININVNNNFNRNTNINTGGGNWQHNAQHRGGTPYADKATASKYGGSARGDSLSSRQASARQQGGAATGRPPRRYLESGRERRAGHRQPTRGAPDRAPAPRIARASAGTANGAGAPDHPETSAAPTISATAASAEQRTEPQRLRGQLERLQRRERPVGGLAGRFQAWGR